MRRAHSQSGFTLVEMLIALFVFALISIGTMSALMNTIRGKAQVSERLDGLQEIETARSLLKADMSSLILRPTRDAYGGDNKNLMEGGVDTLLTFTRTGRINPGGLETRGDLQRVSYVFEQGKLIRRSLAHENPAPLTPELDRVLLDDLRTAELLFVKGDYKERQIFITQEFPEEEFSGIELTLEFEGGQRLTQYFEVSS